MELLVKPRLTEEDFTVGSVIKMGDHMGHNFQLYWPHLFSPVSVKNYNKGRIRLQWSWSPPGLKQLPVLYHARFRERRSFNL
jgi:hypothetical protein